MMAVMFFQRARTKANDAFAYATANPSDTGKCSTKTSFLGRAVPPLCFVLGLFFKLVV